MHSSAKNHCIPITCIIFAKFFEIVIQFEYKVIVNIQKATHSKSYRECIKFYSMQTAHLY